jgi:hypothetical protein
MMLCGMNLREIPKTRAHWYVILATHDPRDPIVDETSHPVDFGINRQFSDVVCGRDDLFC